MSKPAGQPTVKTLVSGTGVRETIGEFISNRQQDRRTARGPSGSVRVRSDAEDRDGEQHGPLSCPHALTPREQRARQDRKQTAPATPSSSSCESSNGEDHPMATCPAALRVTWSCRRTGSYT